MKITPIKLNFALRCTFCVPLIAIVCFAATQPAEADQIVNVAASTYGDPASGLSTLNIFEPAGTYTITEVDPGTPGATYTAWDPIGFNNSSTWVNTLWVFEGSAGNEIKIATLGSGTVFSSPQAAFSDPNNQPVTVTLTSPGYLDFGVDDNYLPDNLGGISADIHAVPEYSSNIILIGILLPVILYSVQAKRDKKIQETCP